MYKNEEELEEGFDLHSKNLFGSNEINWLVEDVETNRFKGKHSRSQSAPLGMLPILFNDDLKNDQEQDEKRVQEPEVVEEVEDDISDSSFEDLESEKCNLKELSVGKVRNFTERDVILTVLDDKFRKGALFKTSDQITIKQDSPVGIDLSNDINFYSSPYYQMLFGLQKLGSEYKYIVFAHGEQFHVKKYRVLEKSAAESATATLEPKNPENIPGANLV